MHLFIGRFAFSLLLLIAAHSFVAQAQTEAPVSTLVNEQIIPLWGNTGAPDTNGVTLKEQWTEFGSNSQVPQRSVTQISTPSLTAFIPAQPNGAAMVVIPGGGYNKVVFDKEGVEIARWLTSLGITAFVLKYRLPAEWPGAGYKMPYQDAQRAMRLLRANAQQWGLDAKRIGVMGFSAGGNLAANLGTAWDITAHKPVDAIDKENARPDLMVLIYGSFENPVAHSMLVLRSIFSSNENIKMVRHFEPIKRVSSNTSPAFILAAHNDSRVPASQSAKFYLELLNAKVSAELHIYRDGEHGFAISKTNGLPVAEWTKQCAVWMKQIGFL